ncbi:hypothetical protein TNCV_4777351 [Trichonephila clavipes]|nr:hypothetical protein TNCV_4777351 [Trichonephila clavipes]
MVTSDLKVVSWLQNQFHTNGTSRRTANITTEQLHLYKALFCIKRKMTWRTTALQFVHDLAAVSGRRISRPGIAELKTLVRGHHKNEGGFFSVMSRNVPDKDSRRVFTWRENGARFRPSYVTKIDRFGDKGILVCGGIMFDSRTLLYLFDAGSVDSQSSREETQEVYVMFFWMLWARTIFLWT